MGCRAGEICSAPVFGGGIAISAEAYAALQPMVERVLRDREFFEWYDRFNVPAGKVKEPSPELAEKGWGALAKGAAQFRGAAGALVIAMDLLRAQAGAKRA